jgi:hypothetical protein
MDWKTILTSFITSGLTVFIFQTIAKNGISHYYSKKLEKFKDEIAIHSDQRKFDIQRKVYDFEKYTTKRHDVYSELFSKVNACKISSLVLKEQSFLDGSFIKEKDSLKRYIEGYISEEKEIDLLMDMYNLKSTEALNDISKHMFSLLCKEQIKKIDVLNKYYSDNELYLSDNVAKKGKEVLSLVILQSALLINAEERYTELEQTEKEINEMVKNLKIQMKKELSIGDYNL